jgi:hypothetical protein
MPSHGEVRCSKNLPAQKVDKCYGRSIISLVCEHAGATGGIILSTDNGLVSDKSWKCARTASDGWNLVWNHFLNQLRIRINEIDTFVIIPPV